MLVTAYYRHINTVFQTSNNIVYEFIRLFQVHNTQLYKDDIIMAYVSFRRIVEKLPRYFDNGALHL